VAYQSRIPIRVEYGLSDWPGEVHRQDTADSRRVRLDVHLRRWILSVLDGLSHLATEQNVFEAILVYFVSEYFPPTSIEDVLIQAAVGSRVAGITVVLENRYVTSGSWCATCSYECQISVRNSV